MNLKKCRFCGHQLNYTFAYLGMSPLANEYVSKENLDKGQYYYPLTVKVCDNCFLVQTIDFKKPEDIFTEYKYFSSFSKSWLDHCKDYVDMIVPSLQLSPASSVVEIACNDGYLLKYFQPHGITPYGIEPAGNIAQKAMEYGIDVVVDFFSDKLVPSLITKYQKADLIIGNNVLAHVPDINGFVKGLKLLLDDKGNITIEFPHLLKLIQLNQFDTIYHEHFSYLSLIVVKKIFRSHGLKIIKVEELNTHGGSLRIYATHTENINTTTDESVIRVLTAEKESGLDKIETYTNFSQKTMQIKRDSVRFLSDIKDRGKSIAAFGAAAKGNTFLNYCGIGKDYIDYVVDSNIYKQGFSLPGTHIPIVDKSKLFESKPDYVVILPWNISKEITEELCDVREWCKLITFIPELKVF